MNSKTIKVPSKDAKDAARAKKNKPKKGEELDKHRHNIRIILQCSNATPIRCRSGIGYACSFCSEQYPEANDLKTHTLDKHDDKCKMSFMKFKPMMNYVVKLDITDLKCNICNQNIDALDDLIEHLTKAHGKKYYADIKNHILPFKFHSEVLRCVICSNHFSKFKMLQEHMNLHYRNYVCEVCDAGFVNRQFLQAHSYKHDTGVFPCAFCPKVLDSHIKKKEHEKVIHIHKGKTSKCSYCGEKFSVYTTRNQHMVTVHGAKPILLKCQACDKSFDKKSALTRHVKRDHLMERKHACTDCEMAFFTKKQLVEHMTKHTGQRNYACNVCFKTYTRNNSLREHLRIHVDDRRFTCKHCPLTFIQKCSLKSHLKSRHGVTE